jgi:predicted nucleic acid-binding protein
MEITIDTSAVISVCLNEPTKALLVSLSEGCSLIAPRSIHWEVGNALSAMLKRNVVDLNTATSYLRSYHAIPIKMIDVDLEQSLSIASRYRMYAYDAYLLSCAMQYSTSLMTLDGPMKIAARQLGIRVLGDS